MAYINSVKSNDVALIEAITEWWSRELESKAKYDGRNIYLVTFTFKHIPGTAATKLTTMQHSVSCFYSTMLKRVVRKPKSIYYLHKRPRMLVAPDYPIFKHEKKTLMEVRVNDGLHMHAILGVPLKSRLKEEISSHVERKRHAYIKAPLYDVHFAYIEADMKKVTDYAFKAIKRGRCRWEDLLILPKSRSE
jgi:hypothetical protein